MPIDSVLSRPRGSTGEPRLVSVVVCTLNRADMLDGALKSLREQQTDGSIKFEILVVDDGSSDSTGRVVAAQQNVAPISIRYLRQDHAGVAAARNRGVIEAVGDWIAFFDDDQIAESNWLIRLTEKAVEKNADIVGGPYLLRLPPNCELGQDPTIRRLLGEEPTMMREDSSTDTGLHPRKREAIPSTGNALVRRTLFDQVGMFSEGMVYGEDREFFRRAIKAGACFATAPCAIIYHIVPSSRLTDRYLLHTAAIGGRSQAEIDEYRIVLWRALLRFVHLVVVAVPRLGCAFALRNRAGILGRRCSIRWSLEYIAVAMRRWKRHRVTSRDSLADLSASA
jgi:glycosyltransferase involved in cell wall biosynthesis